MIDRSTALGLDADDPLKDLRDEFVIADPDLVYLDGNSLGMTPRRTIDAVRAVLDDQWAGGLIRSWWEQDWLNLPLTVGNELAPLLGARADEVVVAESTTVSLFQLVNVALELHDAGRSRVIAVADSEFPTDRYIVEGIAALRPDTEVRRGFDDLDGVDVIVRSLVDYRTAQLCDLAAETARGKQAGATTVWDLSHAAGVVQLDLDGAGVELAAGCTYKFLNGGPGAPAFSYVRTSLHDAIRQPIWGWFAQSDQFAMDNRFDARPGIAQMMNGTPGVLGLAAARAGISVSVDAGIEAIAAKATKLASFAIDLTEQLDLVCPTLRPPASSGGHVSVLHPDAVRIQSMLVEQNVIVDKRDPDVLRLGLSPLTTRFTDVYDALTLLRRVAEPARQ